MIALQHQDFIGTGIHLAFPACALGSSSRDVLPSPSPRSHLQELDRGRWHLRRDPRGNSWVALPSCLITGQPMPFELSVGYHLDLLSLGRAAVRQAHGSKSGSDTDGPPLGLERVHVASSAFECGEPQPLPPLSPVHGGTWCLSPAARADVASLRGRGAAGHHDRARV